MEAFSMSPTLRSHFSDYASFHRTAGNQACHAVGIPLIVLSLFAMMTGATLGTIAGYPVSFAEVVLVLVTLYYLTLDILLAAAMLAAAALMIVVGRHIPFWWALGLFAFGWAFQFVGHYRYEKKSPAFYKNLTHLLVGPLFILAKAVGRA
jgi:uncharacterized membrane protein YGL010W